MGWFKNFIKIFNTNEIEEDHEEYQNQAPFSHENIKGQIETKVTYQYPKGNFRFPLKVDNDSKMSYRQNHAPPAASVKQHPLNNEKVSVSNKKSSRPIDKPVQKTNADRSFSKIQPKNKQPFRPTEIPSPVYGFHKPPRRRKTNQEHVQKDAILDENQHETIIKTNDLKEEPFYEQTKVEPTINYQDIHSELSHSVLKQNSFSNVFIENDSSEKEESAIGNGFINEEAQSKFEKIDEVLIEEFKDIDEIEQKEIESQTEGIEGEIEEKKYEIEPNNEEIKVSFDHPIQVNELEISEKVEESLLNDSNNEEKSHVDDIDQVCVNPANSNEAEFESEQEPFEFTDQTHISTQEDPSDDNHEEERTYQSSHDLNSNLEAPVRTHIPFNVIMLKKDREKLSAKQMDHQSEIQNANFQIAADAEQELQEYVEEDYVFPSLNLLNPPEKHEMDRDWVMSQSEILDETMVNFNVRAKVVNVSQGPSVTRFEVQPEPGVKVNKITNLSDDIKLSLAAKEIRMEAPIPGKHTIGIEMPNAKSRPVFISEIISSEIFQKSESPLTAALGLDISGKPIITDLRKMPHGLIAGATGSGKSVCINSILISLLYKSTPDELKLLMIDPKMVELAPYNHIPHLVSPVITDVKAATAALKWAVEEMERRYELFAHTGVREIQRYNELAEQHRKFNQKLPFIVIVIDELADLMMIAPADVEEAICRIAQKARACGIHLIIATQRPSVDVITGLIKANVPTRIAFSVSSQVDSRTIIDISGAEKLLGRGDMLFLENGSSKPVRLQGTYVSDDEIDQVVAHVRSEKEPDYLFEQEELLKKAIVQAEEDEIFQDACEFVIEQGAASTSLIQRNFRIGYNRAARLIEMMEQQGIISEARGSKPRDILISREDFDSMMGTEETNM